MQRIFTIITAIVLSLTGLSAAAATTTQNNNSANSQLNMSVEQLKQAAAKSDPDAEYALGYMYYYGKDGVTQDTKTAQMWIQKAADQGQAQAIKALQLLQQAQGVAQQPTTAANSTNRNSSITTSTSNPANSATEVNTASNTAASDVANSANNMNAANTNTMAASSNDNNGLAQSQAMATQATATSAATETTMTAQQHNNASAVSENESSTMTMNIQRLLAAPSHYYTVQLYGAFHQNDATHFIKEHRLGSKATYYQTTFENKPWFTVVYGIYKTDAEAQAAIKSLPSNVQRLKPWIKPLAEVKEGIRNKATG